MDADDRQLLADLSHAGRTGLDPPLPFAILKTCHPDCD
jgi:hypothetical protein